MKFATKVPEGKTPARGNSQVPSFKYYPDYRHLFERHHGGVVFVENAVGGNGITGECGVNKSNYPAVKFPCSRRVGSGNRRGMGNIHQLGPSNTARPGYVSG